MNGRQCIQFAALPLPPPPHQPGPDRARGPGPRRQRKTTTSSKTNLLPPCPLCHNKWLPGVPPGQLLFVFIWVISWDQTPPRSTRATRIKSGAKRVRASGDGIDGCGRLLSVETLRLGGGSRLPHVRLCLSRSAEFKTQVLGQ